MIATIHIAAAVVIDDAGRILLVRKRGTAAFMLPGGKIEAGEAAEAAMVRELGEEIGCRVASARPLGRFMAPAANEADHIVDATLFAATLCGVPRPVAEIEALLWLDPTDPGDTPLAPLVAGHVLKLARALSAGQRLTMQSLNKRNSNKLFYR
jgi:8-oxo-dGTP diphosphatase